jgi:peptide/nickel transport system ATP-binding protein/oligopeptide transport system ATP-binding protein
LLKEALLQIKDLKVTFKTDEGLVKAIDGIDLVIKKSEALGLVGESGCGKSMTAYSILRLVPPPGKIECKGILFDGVDLLKLSEREMRKIRGGRISMIFQEPVASLNPVFTVGNQILEALMIHKTVKRSEAFDLTLQMLRKVGIPSPEETFKRYPHELSGGMCQRVMIAMALITNPDLLIADEPTTALDVTIAAQILDLIKDLQKELGMAILLITHDFGIIAKVVERVAVVYAGKIMELGSVNRIFERPMHPYTIGLLKSIPDIDKTLETNLKRLHVMPGSVPDPLLQITGCSFHPRCTDKKTLCEQRVPELKEVEEDHLVRCWKF